MTAMSQPPVPPQGQWAPPNEMDAVVPAQPAAPAASTPSVAQSGPALPWIDYPILFNTGLAHRRLADAKRARNWRFGSLIVSALISAAIWYFFRESLGDVTWWFVAIALGLPVVQLVLAFVRQWLASRDTRRVHDGLALGLTPDGLQIEQAWLPWTEVASVKAGKPRWARSSDLIVQPKQGKPFKLPMDFLSLMPAGVDSGIRALSGGRVWVDFSDFDA